jgi:plasmid stabilization system protein ParE
MRVIISPAAERAARNYVLGRADHSGYDSGERLEKAFRRIYRLLETAELGSTRNWAPPRYKFIPVDGFHVIWRYDETQPGVRVVVRVILQRAQPAQIVRNLR